MIVGVEPVVDVVVVDVPPPVVPVEVGHDWIVVSVADTAHHTILDTTPRRILGISGLNITRNLGVDHDARHANSLIDQCSAPSFLCF